MDKDIARQNRLSFPARFYIYQAERFPFLTHGLLISAFSFSAVSYSRICRGQTGFIPVPLFLAGVFITITLFFLLRIFDEFKDKEEDASFRSYLPVPRGLISLQELKITGIVIACLQIVVNLLFFPKMLIIYGIVIAYLLLMGKEFFVSKWLKEHQMAYVVSHMVIVPLVDIYASGLDWFLSGIALPFGLIFFFCVSFMNGIVLEYGRKIRTPGEEELGVTTYSHLYGPKKAAYLWLLFLFATLLLSLVASWYAGYGVMVYTILGLFFILCASPAILFLNKMTKKRSKMIEYASGLWTLAMYLTLGGGPMIGKLLFT